MLKLNQEYLGFIKALNENRVEYMLVGGYAINYYGYSRPTGDIDIFVNPTHDNKKKLITALEQFGYRATKLSTVDFTQPVGFTLVSRHFKLTFLIKFPEFYFRKSSPAKISLSSMIFQSISFTLRI